MIIRKLSMNKKQKEKQNDRIPKVIDIIWVNIVENHS